MDNQTPQQPPAQPPEQIQVVTQKSGVNLSVKTIVISSVLLLGIGAAIGRFEGPAKVVTKTETKVVTQTVVKEVEKKSTENKKNTVTTITETTKPDGTKTRTIVIRNKDDIKVVDNTKVDEKTNTTSDTKSSTVTTYDRGKWSVEALASVSKPRLTNLGTVSYGLEVDRKIIGPISVGVFGLTDQTYGATLGISF